MATKGKPTGRRPAKIEGATKVSDLFKFAPDTLASLTVDPQVARFDELDEHHVRNLAQSIADEGQRQPGMFRFGPDSKPRLVDGRHRLAAIRYINENPDSYPRLKGKKVAFAAVYHRLNEREACLASLASNTGKAPTVMDLASAASHLQKLEMTQEEIGRALNPGKPLSPNKVGRLLMLDERLPHRWKVFLHRGSCGLGGRFAESHARAALDMELNEEEFDKWAEKLEAGDASPADLVMLVGDRKRAAGKTKARTIADLHRLLNRMTAEYNGAGDDGGKSTSIAEMLGVDQQGYNNAVAFKFWMAGKPDVEDAHIVAMFNGKCVEVSEQEYGDDKPPPGASGRPTDEQIEKARNSEPVEEIVIEEGDDEASVELEPSDDDLDVLEAASSGSDGTIVDPESAAYIAEVEDIAAVLRKAGVDATRVENGELTDDDDSE
jgi:ParB-like chromosome segregation protein Spo0J